MKKKSFLIIMLLSLFLLLLISCGKSSPKYYIVSFNSNGAEEFQNRAILDGDLIIEPKVPTRVGYSFLGWYNGNEKWSFENDVVKENVTLEARWARVTFTVKFDSNGGSAVEEQIVDSGNFAIKPATPNKENCRFIGWYYETDEWVFNVNRVTDYITLVAMWEHYPTYTVEFNSNGGTPTAPQYIVEGNKLSEPTPPTMKNAKFLGWYFGDVLWNFSTNVITSNMTLTAKWEEISTFTVSFNSNGGSAIEAQHVASGDKAIKPPTPDRQQLSRLIGWYLGDKEWNFDTPITSDIALVAKWQNIYKITFIADENETAVSIYVDEGTLIPKQATPTNENMRFVGWYYLNTRWNFDTDVPSSDITLIAHWEEIPTYTVSFDSAGGFDQPNQFVLEGAHVTDPGNPSRYGYRFDGWYNGEVKWNFNSDKVTSDITLIAKWIETVTVVFDSAGGSFVDPSIIDKNTVVKMPKAPTKKGCKLVAWLLPDGTEWNFNMIVTENMTLSAKWVVAYTVSFDTDGGGEISPLLIEEGSLIPKPNTPTKDSKHLFDKWCIAGTDIAWDFDNMTVTEDITLKAKWYLILPPVKLNSD